MTRTLTDKFQINGVKMLAPDEDASQSFEDIDSADTGRDETAIMRRNVVRYKVGTWSFEYASITDEDYQYMENLFPDEGSFTFTHPSRKDANTLVTSTCYRSKYSISWRNKNTGSWRNYKFNIIEI